MKFLLTTVPAEVVLRRGEAPFLAFLLALLLSALARGFFRLALRSYTSASS